ncbi:hypothetical protein D3C77_553570 [compost metagenome]
MIGKAADDIQQFTLAGCLVISNSSFNHMTRDIKFMAFMEIRPSFLGFFDDKERIQIPIWLLRQLYQIDHTIRQIF